MADNGRRQFVELFEAHRRIVFKVAATYARAVDERADLIQEIGAQAWRAFPAYDHERPFATWLYRVALNVAISQQRSCRRREARSEPFDEATHALADSQGAHEPDGRVRALQRFMQALDPLNRALLVLLLEERSYREIGEVLGLSETNVGTRIARLKQRIRNDESFTAQD